MAIRFVVSHHQPDTRIKFELQSKLIMSLTYLRLLIFIHTHITNTQQRVTRCRAKNSSFDTHIFFSLSFCCVLLRSARSYPWLFDCFIVCQMECYRTCRFVDGLVDFFWQRSTHTHESRCEEMRKRRVNAVSTGGALLLQWTDKEEAGHNTL